MDGPLITKESQMNILISAYRAIEDKNKIRTLDNLITYFSYSFLIM